MYDPTEQAKWIGLPVGYLEHPRNGIGSPNLSDDSTRGIYHATTKVPSRALDILNRVSSRIGAPSFSGGGPPTVVKQVYASGGAIRPISGIIPAPFHTALGVVSTQARSMLDRVRGALRR